MRGGVLLPDMRDHCETELVERLRRQDESALADLSSLYGARMFQLAFRYAQGLPEDRCIPWRFGAVVVDLSHHFQYRDVAAAAHARGANGRGA